MSTKQVGRAAILLVCGLVPAVVAAKPYYDLSFDLSTTAPQIRGRIRVTAENESAKPQDEIVWMLFPNRFAAPDDGINDLTRPFVYPYQEFDPGGLRITAARLLPAAGTPPIPLRVRPHPTPGVPDGCVVEVDLPTAWAPGQVVEVEIDFETDLPNRFGTFGYFEDMMTALGGWYPYLAALRGDGTWVVDDPPQRADFSVTASWDDALHVILNGIEFSTIAAPRRDVAQTIDDVHYLSLVAASELRRDEIDTPATRLVRLSRPPRRHDRRAFGPDQDSILREALRAIVAAPPPAGLPAWPARLLVVEAPLRLDLTAPGEGMVVISDRSLRLSWLLRPFHEVQIAQALHAEALRPRRSLHESARDFFWVTEGVSHRLAEEYLRSARPPARSVQGWIELFNIFAIVDRFESEPKIPFVGAFFDRTRRADELNQQISTFNRELPPGRVVLGKLAQLLPPDVFDSILKRCSAAEEPFVACAEAIAERPLRTAVDQWLQPYPDLNYTLTKERSRSLPDGTYEHEVVVRRASTRAVEEPVDVDLRGLGGTPLRLRWDGRGEQGRLQGTSRQRFYQAIIDPDRKLIETTRADNASPPIPQVVVDSAEVEVSSTEFGFSGLVVGRGRYDYRKDIAAAGFYTNRSLGVTVGPRYHWGERNDTTLYRHNLYAFYTAQALTRGFKDKRAPEVITSGHTNGLGLRYNYNNIFAFDNPTEAIDLRLFADWYDRSLGSDYNYAAWGASVVATQPVWTHRSILAVEVSNGFTQPLGSSRVPNQGLFSLGGSRSIRGIGVEEELGRNLFLVRSELRQTIYPELDLNFLDLLVLRRTQLRLFVDTGSVSNSAGSIYNPAHYAVGVGLGFGLVYDFLGFFPSLAYAEIATRADRRDDVQFLFGTRQAF